MTSMFKTKNTAKKKNKEEEKDKVKKQGLKGTLDGEGEKRRSTSEKRPDDDAGIEDEEERKRREDDRRKREEEEKRKKVEDDKKKEVKAKKDEERKRRKEAAERRKQEEERRRAEMLEDDELETHTLESFSLEGPENYREMYKYFPYVSFPEVFASYDKLQGFARDLNTQIVTPEIVLLGMTGHGKSSVLEGLLGHTVTHVGYNGATKRPLYLNLINNPKYDKPKITIKRDHVIKGTDFDHDVSVSLADLPTELLKRNKLPKPTEEPIYVLYEYKYCCNVTLIDTPGLLKDDEGDGAKTDLFNIAYNVVRLPSRLILCIEEAKDWDKLDMFDVIKQVDPEFTRTTFVYTKFHYELQKYTSTRQINRFLQGAVPDAKCFFVTMLSGKLRDKFSDPEKFQDKIHQATKRDLRTLEQLQFDRRHEGSIGIMQLRQYLLNVAWKKYNDDIPQILKRLRANKADTENRLKKLQLQLGSLNPAKLRSIASDYVVNFLQTIDKLLAGTSEGNPAVNGQTLEEEKNQFGDGEWVDAHNKLIRFDPEEWQIPYWESKLYGGQQFERLLAEFKAVAEHQKLPEVSMDDIATAAGINKLNNIPNYAWAASDLAQQKSQEGLVPLIEQTASRAVYILKRLTDIVEKILDGRRKNKWENHGGEVDVNNIDMYPFFTYHVKDLYIKFVDRTAKVVQQKCLDEFYGTRTIFWEYTEYANRNLPMDRTDADETKKAVDNLASQLFTRLRDRITKNVLLKFYNFLLVPMQTELWNEIQGKVTTLSDELLETHFEVNATKNKLLEDEKALQKLIKSYTTQEAAFIEAATHFSHPVYAMEKKD